MIKNLYFAYHCTQIVGLLSHTCLDNFMMLLGTDSEALYHLECGFL